MTDTDHTQLLALRDQLQEMLDTSTPGLYLPDGQNGFDLRGVADWCRLASDLRDEVQARLDGRDTPIQALARGVRAMQEDDEE